MKKRRLPLGVQSFSKIREAECVYVDKTEKIYQLVTESMGPVFLARPRRFGKSLLCSTLVELFEGRRELFKGLA
ncbi:MAG: AAA family ATPase, partial [Spirochaetaceae bacterium]|nr:AAA family ATPase [Spirochaetaceae bacterium]